MVKKSCSRCMFYEKETGDTCGLDFGRCSAKIPFWVPSIVQDYRSWVSYSQGENCEVFIERKFNKTNSPNNSFAFSS